MSERGKGSSGKGGSRFSAVLGAARERSAEVQPEAGTSAPPPARVSASGRPIGRPKTGKRSDPDWEQVSVYLRKDTHHGVKLALLKAQADTDVSELVEGLLADWLRGQN